MPYIKIIKKLSLCTLSVFTIFLSFNALSATPANFNSSTSIGTYDSTANFEKIDVVVGLSKPPYVIPQGNTGYELELITQLLNKMELSPQYIYVPLGRSIKLLDQGMGEALLTINSFVVPNEEIRTKPYITYQNVAVSVAKDNLNIRELQDLKNHKTAGFQFAHKYLGSEFAAIAQQNNSYIEIPNQFQQVQMLLENRVDVVIMDVNIFNHILERLTLNTMTLPTFKYHFIFPESPYGMAFKDPRNTTKFNKVFDEFNKTDEYAALKAKYRIAN